MANKDLFIGLLVSMSMHSLLLANQIGKETLITANSQQIGNSGKAAMSVTVVSVERFEEVRNVNGGINLLKKTSKKKPTSKAASSAANLQGLSNNESSQGNSEGVIGKYLGDLRQNLEKKKIYPTLGKKLGHQGNVMVSFIVKKNGVLEEMKIETPSEFETLNKGAIETLESYRDFRPFPKEIENELLKVKMLLVFNLKEGERI